MPLFLLIEIKYTDNKHRRTIRSGGTTRMCRWLPCISKIRQRMRFNTLLFQLLSSTLHQRSHKLCRRETTVKPANTVPRWITFVINRESRAYAGRLTPEEIAGILSKACGHWGPGAEYLFNTVHKLEEHRIHDRYLWRLQQLVVQRIALDQCSPQHRETSSRPREAAISERPLWVALGNSRPELEGQISGSKQSLPDAEKAAHCATHCAAHCGQFQSLTCLM